MQLKTYPQIIIRESIKPEHTYKRSLILTKGFLTPTSNTLFLDNKNNTFSASSIQNSKAHQKGFLLELLLHGLNYSAKRLKIGRYSYSLDVHKSETFICNQSLTTIPVKNRIFKRRLLFFSQDRQLLHDIEKKIKGFKKPNIYTGKGLFSREDSYKLKAGKKR